MNNILFIEEFINNHSSLFDILKVKVKWDERMAARKTASFGVVYNYSQIYYPTNGFIGELNPIIEAIHSTLDFKPNNCLINYYLNGKSKMGYHSDQTDILYDGTGVAIVSLGATRTLRFRNIKNNVIKKDYVLPSGSLIYMTNEVQEIWQHAIPKSSTDLGRMSLTFRKMK